MSFYYEVVSEDYNFVKGDWYFGVYEVNIDNVNFELEDEISIIDGSNGIVFIGILRLVTNINSLYRLYLKNIWLDYLKDSKVSFMFNPINLNIDKDLNKSVRVSMVVSSSIYCVIEDGNVIEVYTRSGRVFYGRILKISNDAQNRYSVDCYDLLSDLMRIYTRKVYYNIEVENIVLDLVNEYVPDIKVEYVPTGQKLEKFFVDDYLYNVLKFLATGVGYVIKIDGNILKFEPFGYTETGIVITKNSGKVLGVDRSINDVVNDVWIFGDNLTVNTTEKFTADGSSSEFTVKYSIVGSVKVVINGNELSPEDYEVDSYNGIVKLRTAPASGDVVEISYDYQIPIVVHLNDIWSIQKYGLRSKRFTLKSIKTFDIARNLAKQYIQIFKVPKLTLKIRMKISDFLTGNLDVGKKVSVFLPEKNINDKLIVKSIYIRNNYVDLVIGRDDRDIISWYSEVENRLRELEKVEMSKFLFSEYRYGVDNINMKVIDVFGVTVKYNNSDRLSLSVNDSLGVFINTGSRKYIFGVYKFGM